MQQVGFSWSFFLASLVGNCLLGYKGGGSGGFINTWRILQSRKEQKNVFASRRPLKF